MFSASGLIADHRERSAEIDINPVLLATDGGVAVEALLVVEQGLRRRKACRRGRRKRLESSSCKAYNHA